MTLPVGSSGEFAPARGLVAPERYAREDFIRNQRVIGAALIAFGFLAGFFAPVTLGGSIVLGGAMVTLGQIIFGATLIQQVVGDAAGCSQGKIKRVAAGILIGIGGPIGWPLGGLLWLLSNSDNRRV